MRSVAITAALLLLAGCLSEGPAPSPTPSGAAAPAVAPTFASPVQIEQTGGGGAEPAVAVHPDGTQFVIVWTRLYRSTDAGKTFTKLTTPFRNNGDADLAITSDGALHYVGMTLAGQVGDPRLPYFRSTDKGDTWTEAKDLSAGTNNVDRQFITNGYGLLVLTWNDLTADANLARVSKDAGKTWSEPAKILAPRAKSVGASAIHAKTILQPLNLASRIDLARSLDAGATWSVVPGPAVTGHAYFMPQIAFDEAGVAYLAATMGAGNERRVLLFTSTDAGSTWSAALDLTPPSSHAVFPWVVAGARGRVAVSFYERDVANGVADAPWYPRVVVSTSADQGSGWTGARVVAEPIRTRDICSGDGCPQETWSFKDLFELAVTKEGRPFVAWMKEVVAPGAPIPLVGGGGSTLTVQASTATSGWTAFG